MGNCSNISNTQTVSLTSGTLTSGFCHTSLQTTYEEFITKTSAALTGNLAGFVAGDDTPSAGDQDKLWWKQNASGCAPLGWYYWDSGTSAWAELPVTDTMFPTGSNAKGARTVSTDAPTGGDNGDIWYKVAS